MKNLVLTVLILMLQPFTTVGASSIPYSVTKVNYKNLVANLYLPKSKTPPPVVIAFGGSEGGISTGNANGEMMAPHGVAVLALAYFNEQGLAKTLDQIPMEYFINAIDYLSQNQHIDATKIGVVGGSRGSEAALLMAILDQRVKSVAVTTPSNVAWYGLTKTKSAWTYQGKDIPALGLELDANAKLLDRFSVALKNKEKVNNALLNVEKINGPLLLISAKEDQVWPSFSMSNEIENHLKKHKFPHFVKHDTYQTGHGFSQETAPAIKQSIIDHFLNTLK